MKKTTTEKWYRIGDLARLLGLSVDTLRYYEKIELLPRVERNKSGIRLYGEKDISRLRFIQRAQKMGFSLAEISMLLCMRENPQLARDEVRTLTAVKLDEIEVHLKDLTLLRNEMRLLLNLCQGAKSGCPIIETIDGDVDEHAAKLPPKRRRAKQAPS